MATIVLSDSQDMGQMSHDPYKPSVETYVCGLQVKYPHLARLQPNCLINNNRISPCDHEHQRATHILMVDKN